MAEKLQKINKENKDLRDRLNTLLKQYKITLKEEEAMSLQRQKMAEEYVFVCANQIATVRGA